MSEVATKTGLRLGLAVEPGPPPPAWYAVQTIYRYEQRVSRDLTAKGLGTYLPLLRETRQWTDRKKVIEIPAFSGYLFVRHDASFSSRVRVLETQGVVRILSDNHAPVPVADSEIESLRRALESDLSCRKCEYLSVGTIVEVKRGPLTGIQGRLVRLHNGLRLVLSVSTVSQAISVEVGLEDVEPVREVSSREFSPGPQKQSVLFDIEASLIPFPRLK